MKYLHGYPVDCEASRMYDVPSVGRRRQASPDHFYQGYRSFARLCAAGEAMSQRTARPSALLSTAVLDEGYRSGLAKATVVVARNVRTLSLTRRTWVGRWVGSSGFPTHSPTAPKLDSSHVRSSERAKERQEGEKREKERIVRRAFSFTN